MIGFLDYGKYTLSEIKEILTGRKSSNIGLRIGDVEESVKLKDINLDDLFPDGFQEPISVTQFVPMGGGFVSHTLTYNPDLDRYVCDRSRSDLSGLVPLS
ncbi:hypothetical protein CL618_02405 [archaeon]|nr:hypothetical protein [archaeon]|tara:strand:- start:169 stop:468 length:300 start_codon:yes stop_codon:yes gene_type:complete